VKEIHTGQELGSEENGKSAIKTSMFLGGDLTMPQKLHGFSVRSLFVIIKIMERWIKKITDETLIDIPLACKNYCNN